MSSANVFNLDQSKNLLFGKELNDESCFLDVTENIMGKVENGGYQHFILFQQCLEKFLLQDK